MISRWRYAVAGAAALALIVSEVTVGAAPYSVDLFNSTEYPIEVLNARSGRPLHTLQPGRSTGVAYADGIAIRTPDGRRLHFDRVDPPREFIRTAVFVASFRAQLSRDFRIWVILPTGKRPALPPPAQPPGFPLAAR